MSRSPSPHMVLALQAGLVSQELFDALTVVDDKLFSACLFAEYWDTHSDRDAWLQQHLSSRLHSLAVPLHQWCCEQSASWARGAVHVPVFSSQPSCQPTAPSSSMGARRIPTGFGGHAQYHSIVGPTTWTPSGAQLVHFVFGQANRSPSQNYLCNRAISWHASSTQPVVQAVPVVGCRQKTVTVRVFPQNYQYRRCRFLGKVGITRFFGAKIHCIEFGLVGQILGCACFIFSHSKCHHGRDQNFSQRP